MLDKHGRKIEYLRVSVTQNCNLRCIYCMPHKANEDDSLCTRLTSKEFGTIIKTMAGHGIKKVRVTGGEPLTRLDICDIVKEIASIKGIEDISMTTNGINLYNMIGSLKQAGLKRLNISMDSLREDRFKYITGGGSLNNVLKGVEKALESGLTPLKINTVLVKGVNDDEVGDFISLARDRKIDVRFIELMPIGAFGEKNADRIVYNNDIIKSYPALTRCEDYNQGQPAVHYKMEGYKGKIGFISPMSHKFCDCCNRIRLTCDGRIKPCLGDNGEVSVIDVLRNRPQELDSFIKQAIYEKPEGHNFERSFSSARSMSMIGG